MTAGTQRLLCMVSNGNAICGKQNTAYSANEEVHMRERSVVGQEGESARHRLVMAVPATFA